MKTVILGASPNPARMSHRVTLLLLEMGYVAVPVGLRSGAIGGQPIRNIREQPPIAQVHTITLYMNARNQQPWYQYILSLKPQRIIFNPGAENRELDQLAVAQGIETEDSCTLVMLRISSY